MEKSQLVGKKTDQNFLARYKQLVKTIYYLKNINNNNIDHLFLTCCND
jgi:hypothetical protein